MTRNKEKTKAAKARHYQKYKDKIKAKSTLYAKLNPEKRKVYRDKWRANNLIKAREMEALSHAKNKIHKAEYQRLARKANPGMVGNYNAKRRSSKAQRTPKWLSHQQYADIKQFYIDAKDLQWLSSEPLQVDHIIPLSGKNVSGLHVPWNLQILPRPLNCKKSNKYGND